LLKKAEEEAVVAAVEAAAVAEAVAAAEAERAALEVIAQAEATERFTRLASVAAETEAKAKAERQQQQKLQQERTEWIQNELKTKTKYTTEELTELGLVMGEEIRDQSHDMEEL
jgi:membrane protein involved in colicin uptake